MNPGALSPEMPTPNNSFCLFEFDMKKSVLQENFENNHLIIEVMDKGKSTYDTRVGVAVVNLMDVFRVLPFSGSKLLKIP